MENHQRLQLPPWPRHPAIQDTEMSSARSDPTAVMSLQDRQRSPYRTAGSSGGSAIQVNVNPTGGNEQSALRIAMLERELELLRQTVAANQGGGAQQDPREPGSSDSVEPWRRSPTSSWKHILHDGVLMRASGSYESWKEVRTRCNGIHAEIDTAQKGQKNMNSADRISPLRMPPVFSAATLLLTCPVCLR